MQVSHRLFLCADLTRVFAAIPLLKAKYRRFAHRRVPLDSLKGLTTVIESADE